MRGASSLRALGEIRDDGVLACPAHDPRGSGRHPPRGPQPHERDHAAVALPALPETLLRPEERVARLGPRLEVGLELARGSRRRGSASSAPRTRRSGTSRRPTIGARRAERPLRTAARELRVEARLRQLAASPGRRRRRSAPSPPATAAERERRDRCRRRGRPPRDASEERERGRDDRGQVRGRIDLGARRGMEAAAPRRAPSRARPGRARAAPAAVDARARRAQRRPGSRGRDTAAACCCDSEKKTKTAANQSRKKKRRRPRAGPAPAAAAKKNGEARQKSERRTPARSSRSGPGRLRRAVAKRWKCSWMKKNWRKPGMPPLDAARATEARARGRPGVRARSDERRANCARRPASPGTRAGGSRPEGRSR